MELLPEVDRDFLEEREYKYQLVQYAAGIYLIIEEFDFPLNYRPNKATLLILVPTGYPLARLDMFWTSPDVKLSNGAWPTAANVYETHNGTSWQRWSRHYTWRGGVDNLRTYISAIKKELAKGI